GDPCHQGRVPEAVLGEPEPLHDAVGRGDQARDRPVLLDLFQGEQSSDVAICSGSASGAVWVGTSRGLRGLAHRWSPASLSADGLAPSPRALFRPSADEPESFVSSSGSSSSNTSRRAMACFSILISVFGATSRRIVPSSSSISVIVPYMPPWVTT